MGLSNHIYLPTGSSGGQINVLNAWYVHSGPDSGHIFLFLFSFLSDDHCVLSVLIHCDLKESLRPPAQLVTLHFVSAANFGGVK